MIAEAIAAHLADPSSGFTIGSLGAIAEFFRDHDEPTEGADNALRVVTARGAIRVELRDEVLPLAYETLSTRMGLWQHGVLFCLPETSGRGVQRTVITELGPDAGAVRPCDRGAVLFDLGLGQRNVDFCVRTADAGLIAILRSQAGGSVGPIMNALIDASPHRVALAALGRIEVYQPIDRKRSPDGPHAHVLAPLLKTGRTHSANVPVPDGYVPCLALYPAHPLFDIQGRARSFDAARHRAFQAILSDWGDGRYVAEKRRVEEAMQNGAAPSSYAQPSSRLERLALRIAVRQRRHLDETVQAWSDRFD